MYFTFCFSERLFISPSRLSYNAARTYCEESNAHLVTFESEEKYIAVTNWVWNQWNVLNQGWALKAYWTDMKLTEVRDIDV